MTIPPAAVIALRELAAKWRKYAAGQGAIYASGIYDVLDELDALVARVEPQEVAHESRSPDGDGLGTTRPDTASDSASGRASNDARTAESSGQTTAAKAERKSPKAGAGSEPADSHTHPATARVEPPLQELLDALQPFLRRWNDASNASSYLWTLVLEYEPELPGSSCRQEMLKAVQRLEATAAPRTPQPQEPDVQR